MNPRALGVHILHGCPGAGKSKGALALVLRFRAQENPRIPVLIIDPQRAWNFEPFPETNRKEIWNDLFKRRGVYRYVPESDEDFDWALTGAIAGKGILVIVDEFRHYANSHYVSRALSLACRQYRHNQTGLYLTTQHLSDCHAEITSCMTKLYTYKCVSPRILDRLEREYGLNRERVKNLRPDECIILTGGFEDGQIAK